MEQNKAVHFANVTHAVQSHIKGGQTKHEQSNHAERLALASAKSPTYATPYHGLAFCWQRNPRCRCDPGVCALPPPRTRASLFCKARDPQSTGSAQPANIAGAPTDQAYMTCMHILRKHQENTHTLPTTNNKPSGNQIVGTGSAVGASAAVACFAFFAGALTMLLPRKSTSNLHNMTVSMINIRHPKQSNHHMSCPRLGSRGISNRSKLRSSLKCPGCLSFLGCCSQLVGSRRPEPHSASQHHARKHRADVLLTIAQTSQTYFSIIG